MYHDFLTMFRKNFSETINSTILLVISLTEYLKLRIISEGRPKGRHTWVGNTQDILFMNVGLKIQTQYYQHIKKLPRKYTTTYKQLYYTN